MPATIHKIYASNFLVGLVFWYGIEKCSGAGVDYPRPRHFVGAVRRHLSGHSYFVLLAVAAAQNAAEELHQSANEVI